MEKENIIQILDRWNFWNRQISTGIKREFYLKKIIRYLSSPEILALIGVRRSGKSTILLQVIKFLIKQGVKPINTLFINFEEPFFEVNSSPKFLTEILEAYLEFFNPKGKIYLFLDEVQQKEGWEKFVASLYNRKENIKIFITGSSSKLLKTEISTLLAGRYFSETIYPLNFKEFLSFKKLAYNNIKSPKIFYHLNEYLQFGGFPRIVLEKDKNIKNKLLEEYYSSIVEKDVILRNRIKNVREIKELLLFLLSNIGNQISTYNIEKILDISNVNVRRYLEYFKESFLIDLVDFFSYKVKKQIYNPRKIYCIDSGLANIASFKFSENKGKILENVVFNHLRQKKKKLFYWRNKTEVDFVARNGYQIDEVYNVCFSIKNKATYQRELNSLEIAKKELACQKTHLIFWEKGDFNKEDVLMNIIDFLTTS